MSFGNNYSEQSPGMLEARAAILSRWIDIIKATIMLKGIEVTDLVTHIGRSYSFRLPSPL